MIHYFNPGHETAVLNGSPYYMHPANVALMQSELAYLPAWYAHRGDVVLVYNESDRAYYENLLEHIDGLPKPILEQDIVNYATNEICLWGISPQAIYRFEDLNKKYGTSFYLPKWHDEYRYLNSRLAARDCLSDIQQAIPLIDSKLVPRVCTSLEDVGSALKDSSVRLLAKAPYSSSGRGLLWLPSGELPRSERQILQGILKKQGCVSIERVVDKQIDFAMEFMCDGMGKVVFEGYSLFDTNIKGAYMGNSLTGQDMIERLIAEKIGYILLDKVKEVLKGILSERYAVYYNGCVGVDMMIYREDGEYKLHPCVEINMRYNMGYLALRFAQKYLADDANGYYHIDFNACAKDAYRFHCEMAERYPAKFEDGKIVSGYLSLCPVRENSHYRAFVSID